MSTSLLGLASLMEPLRGFVAVGRRMSITVAASDLCLTQSALSRQVQALEDRLGAKLLVRGHRSISFTPEGERLFRSADSAVQQLQDIFATIAADRSSRPVTLSASIGVTGLWILPKVGQFQELHPDVDLRIAADNRTLDLAAERIDLAIRYGVISTMPADARLLFRETVAPVAHPSLGIEQLSSPEDIARQVLLEFDIPGRRWLHWADWLAAAGWAGVKPKGIVRFNQYDQVIQSAMAGQGIALGRVELIGPMLLDGRLRQVAAPHPGSGNDYAYWLVQAEAVPRPDVSAVIGWILAEIPQRS